MELIIANEFTGYLNELEVKIKAGKSNSDERIILNFSELLKAEIEDLEKIQIIFPNYLFDINLDNFELFSFFK